MLKRYHLLIFGVTLFFVSIFLSSCDKDMSIALDSGEIDALNLNAVDSMSVHVSTVVLANIPTSGSGALLVGKYSNANFGSTSVSSYFPVEPSSYTNDIPSGATFDSINLVLRPVSGRYFYGDTAVVQKISVHRLLEPLEQTTLTAGGINNVQVPLYVEGSAIFGQQTFSYDTNPLGELSFRPRPLSFSSLSVKMDDSFGQDLFDKIVSNANQVSSSGNFLEYLKGLVIVPDDDNTCVFAFNDTIQANINYSYLGSDGLRQTGSKTLSIANYNLKYNHFDTDRVGTAFENLAAGSPVTGSSSDGVGYIQAGTGVSTQIRIPSLNEFLRVSDIAINKVELEIELLSTLNQALYPFPSVPVLYVMDGSGTAIDYVRIPFTTSIQQGTIVAGNNTGRNAKIRFNLIEYIKTINNPNLEDRSLVLSLAPPTLFMTANSAVIAAENNKPKIKLNILYTKFK